MHVGRRDIADVDVPRGGARERLSKHHIGVLIVLTPHLCNVIS